MPAATTFGPLLDSARELDQVILALDEFEAVRLADLEELYQERAAERMGVSRPTFSRMIDSAHRKIAEALVSGKTLRIQGGAVRLNRRGLSRCPQCGREAAGARGCPRCRERRASFEGHAPGAVSAARHCRRVQEGEEPIR